MDYTQIAIGLLGGVVGGVIVTIVRYFLDRSMQTRLKLNDTLEEKYRGLLIFMACALDIEKRRYFTLHEQQVNRTSEDYMNQIKEYYFHSLLYSSDEVILAVKQFIGNPNKQNYVRVAQQMRHDLWSRGTKLKFEDIAIA